MGLCPQAEVPIIIRVAAVRAIVTVRFDGHRQLGAGLGGGGRDGSVAGMISSTKPPCAGYRFPGEVISQAVWLYFRFP